MNVDQNWASSYNLLRFPEIFRSISGEHLQLGENSFQRIL